MDPEAERNDEGNAGFVRSGVLATAICCKGLKAAAPAALLRETAQASEILMETAVRPWALSETAYSSTLAREFNMVEPEDALKWEIIHPQLDTYDCSQGEQVVDFAQRHGMKVRGHTLVWHQQNPKWLKEGKFTSRELT